MLKQIGLWVSTLLLIFPQVSLAETKLSYPELEVTPRASERLALEAKREETHRFFVHWPIQVSALATIIVSNQTDPETEATADEKDEYEDKKSRALMIGAGWFIASAALSAVYRPYRSGNKEISAMPSANMREQLVKERLAEEALYRPATVTSMMNWLAVLSNLYANGALINGGSSSAKAVAGLGTFAALLPIIFEHRWQAVSDMHKEYKKKIYGPVSGPVLLPIENNKFAYGTALQWSF